MKRNVLFVERRLTFSPSSPDAKRWDLVVRIYAPVKLATEWKCIFSLSTDEIDEAYEAYGEDGLQALINAIEAARQHVHSQFPYASWLTGIKGDIGLPIIIPSYIPLPLAEFRILREKVLNLVNTFVTKQSKGDQIKKTMRK